MKDGLIKKLVNVVNDDVGIEDTGRIGPLPVFAMLMEVLQYLKERPARRA